MRRLGLATTGTILLLVTLGGSAALADPVVPGFTLNVYAAVTDPNVLSFDATGALHVGRDASGSGGSSGAAVRVHRIGAGGSPVTEYGAVAIPDPDSVLVDATGAIAGTPGSLLVAGDSGAGGGHIVAILPDQTVRTLFGPTTAFRNPHKMLFDETGRLLIADPGRASGGTAQVLASTGGFPTTLFTLPSDPVYLAVDGTGRIFSSAQDGVIRVHSADGALLNASFATGVGGGPIAFGNGGAFGTALYAVNGSGNLMRFDSAGSATVIGTGFSSASDLAFGPDGALYVSLFASDRIVRIARPAVAPGFFVGTYASVTDPIRLSFDASGTLFVGRDASGSGGGNADAVRVHRVPRGGAPVAEYGGPIPDPDTVVVDATGGIAGTAGAVLVGGVSGGQGRIVAILPDQSVRTVFGPTTAFVNPDKMVFDGAGRLLITDVQTNRVLASSGAFPATLFTLPTVPASLAVDPAGRIFTTGADGTIRIHDAGGNLVNAAFATGLRSAAPIAFGPGGSFGTDLYVVNGDSGNLLAFDGGGRAMVVGTGFAGATDLAFGPDGALYVSMFPMDAILRIAVERFAIELACPATARRGTTFDATLTFRNDTGVSRDVTRVAVLRHVGELRVLGPSAVQLPVALAAGAVTSRSVPVLVPGDARPGSLLGVGLGVLGRVAGEARQRTLGTFRCAVEVTGR